MKVRAWIDRGNRYFAIDWRIVPFQPILYLCLFVGAVLVHTVSTDHPSFTGSTFFWWVTLSTICPPLAFSSWVLIHWFPGKPRYFGYWMRFAADFGQFCSLSAFLTAISATINPIAAELYASEIFAAAWLFIVLLLIRDAWKLVLNEQIAGRIHKDGL